LGILFGFVDHIERPRIARYIIKEPICENMERIMNDIYGSSAGTGNSSNPFFWTPSSTVKMVLDAQKNPSSTVQMVLDSQKHGSMEGLIKILQDQFQRWLQELLDMANASNPYQYIHNPEDISNFLGDLTHFLKNPSFEQFALFAQLYFPDGRPVNFQGLRDLDDALAAITDGHREVFSRVIKEIGPQHPDSPQAQESFSQNLREYANWAAPRVFDICCFAPDLVNKRYEHFSKISTQHYNSYYYLGDAPAETGENKPDNFEVLIQAKENYLISSQLLAYNANMFANVHKRFQAMWFFMRENQVFFQFDQQDYRRISTLQEIEKKSSELKEHLENMPAYPQFLAGNLGDDHPSAPFLKVQVENLNKMKKNLTAIKRKELSASDLSALAAEFSVLDRELSPKEQVWWILYNWFGILIDIETTTEFFTSQTDTAKLIELLDAKQSLWGKEIDEMTAVAAKYGIPMPQTS